METFDEALNRLVADHQAQYRNYSKLVLSLSTGAIGLLTAFRKNWIEVGDVWMWSAQLSLILLLFSFFFGLAVQHLLMYRPVQEANELIAHRSKIESSEESITFKSVSSRIEKLVFRAQLICFYIAIALVVSYVVRNVYAA